MSKSAYRDLEVWQIGIDMVEQIYKVTQHFPKEEQFVLVSQMRRAAISVPSNIAEGAGRRGTKEYINHLSIARGSLFELETQLTIAVRLLFLSREKAIPVWQYFQRIGQMLTRLMDSLSKKLVKRTTNHVTRHTKAK